LKVDVYSVTSSQKAKLGSDMKPLNEFIEQQVTSVLEEDQDLLEWEQELSCSRTSSGDIHCIRRSTSFVTKLREKYPNHSIVKYVDFYKEVRTNSGEVDKLRTLRDQTNNKFEAKPKNTKLYKMVAKIKKLYPLVFSLRAFEYSGTPINKNDVIDKLVEYIGAVDKGVL